jgi:hypothetical protein
MYERCWVGMVLTINVSSIVREQKNNGSRQLIWGAHSPHRISLCPNLSPFRDALSFVQDRVHVSGRDGIASDSIPGPFGRQTIFQC